ncbi:hypothetical protein P171DRAFT_517390 [Karstenula rhodostoma CBS 690.94]|uniref:Uncharacterized protein n=1 Tax=Karstenula rhodostoma CBS 690.94 TaxID=1392251 RepID=A0A9P4UH25_9PLEO|nr:hypothetical protein P171DRAFT_517390 [Karstenula rhodostoma CBS 690.94]
MRLPNLTLLALSALSTLATSTPAERVISLPAILPAPGKTSVAVKSPLPTTAAKSPLHLASVDDPTPEILTYLRSTLAELRKHTLAINSSVAGTARLDVAKRAASIVTIRAEVKVICYNIAQLNTASIARWADSVGDVAAVRAQLSAAVQELVWEVVYTLKGALGKLQCSIWELLGSQVFVLLASYGQLFCVLNVWVDGFLKQQLGLLNAQIALLTSVFSGLLTNVVDIMGGFFTQATKLLVCLLS